MKLIFTIFSVFFLATALISFLVAFLAWKRRLVKGANELAILMLAAGVGSFFLVFETAAPTMVEKIFWSKFEYIGGIFTPVLYLIFVLRFTGKDKLLSLRNILLLLITPFITLILAFTNEAHQLVWSGFSAIEAKTNLMEYFHGPGFWIGYIAYTYLMFFLATIYLVSFIVSQNRTFRSQGWVVLIGGLFPWIASILYLTESNPFPGLDLAPISITMSGILGAYAILNIGFLDLVPVARETLVETLSDGILVLDGQNRIQDINEAARSFLGIQQKNVIGYPALSCGASVALLLNAAIDKESVDPVEIQQDDQIQIFRIIKQTIKDQRGSRLIVIRDITEQVTRQNEIEAGKEKYRHMYKMFRLMADNSDDFMWAKDVDNKYIFCNKIICDRLLMAESVDEPIGKTNEFFTSREKAKYPDNPDWYTFGSISSDTDHITLKEGKPTQFDIFGNVKGEFLFLDVHKAPIRDDCGNLLGIVGTARDVTFTKNIEKERIAMLDSLQKSEDDLKRINAEKDKFFSIIAHDLRNPFSGFVGLTQILADELPNLSTVELKDFAETMKSSAANLFRLLENLLQWSRIQQGLIPFNPEEIGLREVVLEGITTIQESLGSKGIEIIQDVEANIKVLSDSNILHTIVRNLLSNAVKFTPKGGQIHISAHCIDTQTVELSINDTGIGMSEEMIDRLFRVDVQINRKGTEGEPSTGLGLLLCKEFIEKNGGRIRVESEVGKGSAFIFTIPCSKATD